MMLRGSHCEEIHRIGWPSTSASYGELQETYPTWLNVSGAVQKVGRVRECAAASPASTSGCKQHDYGQFKLCQRHMFTWSERCCAGQTTGYSTWQASTNWLLSVRYYAAQDTAGRAFTSTNFINPAVKLETEKNCGKPHNGENVASIANDCTHYIS
eukprot:364743-Chlamydomonas_euryale.AAC.106